MKIKVVTNQVAFLFASVVLVVGGLNLTNACAQGRRGGGSSSSSSSSRSSSSSSSSRSSSSSSSSRSSNSGSSSRSSSAGNGSGRGWGRNDGQSRSRDNGTIRSNGNGARSDNRQRDRSSDSNSGVLTSSRGRDLNSDSNRRRDRNGDRKRDRDRDGDRDRHLGRRSAGLDRNRNRERDEWCRREYERGRLLYPTRLYESSNYGYYQYGSNAYEQGYQDGLFTGASDARRGQTYDPERSHFYKHGAGGFLSVFGSPASYSMAYRDGFMRGYEEGYRNYQNYFRGGSFHR